MLIELPIDKIILDEPVKRDVSVPGSNLSIPSFTAPIKALLTRQLAVLPRRLRIVGLLATRDNGCHQYAKLTAKNCIANGIVFEMRDISSCRDLEEYAAYGETKRAIFEINEDHGVDGLIVYFPLFGPQKDDELRALISPRIDLEGVHIQTLARSYAAAPPSLAELCESSDYSSDSVTYPCPPLAVFRILETLAGVYDAAALSGERMAGKIITVINRSETVGRPLAAMLANESALVLSLDISSSQIVHPYPSLPTKTDIPTSTLLRMSDVVISAVPGGRYKVPTSSLKEGAVCINIAMDSNFEGDVKDRAGIYVERVGAVTILMLQLNCLLLRLQRE